MMLNWNEYMQELATRIGEVGRTSPEIIRGYRTLSEAGQKTNKLDGKIRELIALAVAVTLRCDGCITTHTSAALKNGASEAEIVEALGVAVSVNAAQRWFIPPASSMPFTLRPSRHQLPDAQPAGG